ncbi:Transient receptor potential channel pyrexia [Gryllus bimaculatus]|nr:Transient receptor potential channel pyrexia [Gryllus bimaculatus]
MERFMKAKVRSERTMSKEQPACKRVSLQWLEDTKAELERRVEALEDAQHDVNVRLGKLENAVERSLTSVHHCIDNLLLNLGEKEKEEARGIADIPVEDDAAFPVHLAAQVGNLAAVKALVLAGVDVGIRNQRGKTVLQIAAAGGHSEIVELLLRQHQDSEDDLQSAAAQEQLQEALMNAVDSSVNKLLISKLGRSAGVEVLHRAACKGRLLLLHDLLHSGVDPNAVDVNGWTALHLAADGGHSECVKILLDSDCNGWTALHCAAFNKWPECVKVLLRYGVDIALTNSRGESALHLAACLSTAERDSIGDASAALAQRTQVIKLLLSAGADPNVQSKDGRTALQQDGVQALLQVPSPILAAHLCS